jgi:hypothetical protein
VIDPLTAMAAVSSAVNLIKKAAATVDDVRSLGPLLGKYFDAKHNAVKAVRESKKAGGSNMAKAIEIELALKQQADFERDLQMLFMQTGNIDVWNNILARVQDMNRADIEEERAERDREARAKKQAKEIADALTVLFVAGAVLFVILTLVYQAVA